MSLAVETRAVARQSVFFGTVTPAVLMGGLGAGLLFLAFPVIDLQFGRIFYEPGIGFTGNTHWAVPTLRSYFIVFYFSCVALAIVGLVRTRGARRVWLQLTAMQWLFFAICLGVGPGLVANLLFKDQFGRARPKQITEFGGQKAFTPPLLPARECPSRCSFVSAEASSVFVPFFAAALLFSRWALLLAASGTVAGLVVGLVRISQGAHFLSDVIFAGVFMALTVLVIHRVMFGPGRTAASGAVLRAS